LTFSGGTIAGGGTCTVLVNVTAPVAGTYVNTSGSVSHVINAATVLGNTATGSLTVNPAHPAIGALKQAGLTSNPLGTWPSFLDRLVRDDRPDDREDRDGGVLHGRRKHPPLQLSRHEQRLRSSARSRCRFGHQSRGDLSRGHHRGRSRRLPRPGRGAHVHRHV